MESWLTQIKGSWRWLLAACVALGLVTKAIDISIDLTRKAAGTDALAAQVETLEAKVKEVTREQRRHQILVDMKDNRTRRWNIEDRWAEKFSAQKGRIHDTLAELVHFMTPEARDDFRKLQLEFADLEKDLKKLNEEPEEDDGDE